MRSFSGLCFVCFSSFLMFSFSKPASAQTGINKLDSLWGASKNGANDSIKAAAMFKLSANYRFKNLDSSWYYINQGLKFLNPVHNTYNYRFYLNGLGLIYITEAKYDSALIFLNEVKEKCMAAKDSVQLYDYYNSAAICYDRLGDKPRALDLYIKAAMGNEKLKDYRKSIGIYNNISALYRKQLKDYVKAYEYSLKAISLKDYANDNLLVGASYERAGNALMELKKYDSSLVYNKKSLSIFETTGSEAHIISQYANIGNVYYIMGIPDSALAYTTKGVEAGKNSKFKTWYAHALITHAKALNKKGKYKEAQHAANEALAIGKELKEPSRISDAYQELIEYYKNINDYKNALLYKDSLFQLNDSLNSVTVTNNLNALNVKYETSKKENEIEKLNSDKKIQQLQLEKQKALLAGNVLEAKQKQQEIDLLNQQQQIQELKLTQQREALALKELESQTKDRQLKITEQEKQLKEAELTQQKFSKNLILAGSLVLLAFGALGFNINRINTKRNNEKEKFLLQNQLSEMKLEALRSQMNPHFIFNALNSINRYIIRSDKETASEYLIKFSKLMRLILENSKSTFIPLANELEALRLYVEMELLRFDNKFDFNINIADNVLQDKTQIPPMVLQPFIENAIWHGLMNKKEKGTITVNVESLSSDKLFVVIEDNGVGRQKANELKNITTHTGKSFGMQITKERLATITGSDKNFRIIDLYDKHNKPSGTRIEIEINTQAA